MNNTILPELRFKDNNGNEFPQWKKKKLEEIAEVYQPQTISQADLHENGEYDVWGANGIIANT